MSEDTRRQIEEALKVLVGMPLTDSGRAGTWLQWFSFGKDRTVPDRKGGTRIVGEYALHVQCAWRISGPEGIVVGSADRVYPAGDDPFREIEGFNWDQPGANRCDERIGRFFAERSASTLVIADVWVDSIGSLSLLIDGGYALEVFPHYSLDKEHWRLFKPATEEPHFVVTARGIGDYDEDEEEEDEDDGD